MTNSKIANEIIMMICNDEVTNWPSLELKCVLFGYDITDEVFLSIIDNLAFLKVMNFIHDSISECDDCLRFFKNKTTIDKILKFDGTIVGQQENRVSQVYFNVTEFFDKFEIRHPEVFLNYFIKTKRTYISSGIDGYSKLMNMVLRRTKMRAVKNSIYSQFIPVLEKIENENNMFLTTMV